MMNRFGEEKLKVEELTKFLNNLDQFRQQLTKLKSKQGSYALSHIFCELIY